MKFQKEIGKQLEFDRIFNRIVYRTRLQNGLCAERFIEITTPKILDLAPALRLLEVEAPDCEEFLRIERVYFVDAEHKKGA